MANSIERSLTRNKPKKPRPDFPLFPHATGRWAKKIKGKFEYFGKVADDPKGEAALSLWLEQKDDLLAGRRPRKVREGITVQDLANRFLNAKRIMLEAGEITKKTHLDYIRVCKTVAKVFGEKRIVDDLASDDFELLRAHLAKTRGPVALGNDITRIRVVFKYGYDAGVLDKPVRYGPTFKRPSKKVLRQERQKNGERMLEPVEIRAMIDAASPQLRAMLLLAVNAGFGNSDCGTLPLSAVDLKGGWINYPRPKTAVPRRCPLWTETIAALKKAIAERPDPKPGVKQDLVFLTKYGSAWSKDDHDNPISKETRKLLDSLNVFECQCGQKTIVASDKAKCSCGKRLQTPKQTGVYRPGTGFYTCRHVFRTIADQTRDFPAIDHIMGHSRDDMASVYRERIDDERLRAVADHVHAWLYGPAK